MTGLGHQVSNATPISDIMESIQKAPQAGFGEGTISPLSAAQRTVARNLQSARTLVPSVEELQAYARTQAIEQRNQILSKNSANDDSIPLETAGDNSETMAPEAFSTADSEPTQTGEYSMENTPATKQAVYQTSATDYPVRTDARAGGQIISFYGTAVPSRLDVKV